MKIIELMENNKVSISNIDKDHQMNMNININKNDVNNRNNRLES